MRLLWCNLITREIRQNYKYCILLKQSQAKPEYVFKDSLNKDCLARRTKQIKIDLTIRHIWMIWFAFMIQNVHFQIVSFHIQTLLNSTKKKSHSKQLSTIFTVGSKELSWCGLELVWFLCNCVFIQTKYSPFSTLKHLPSTLQQKITDLSPLWNC